MNKFTQADISDPQELIALLPPPPPSFPFPPRVWIEDNLRVTYIRKDGTGSGPFFFFLVIGTDTTAAQKAEEALIKAGALNLLLFFPLTQRGD